MTRKTVIALLSWAGFLTLLLWSFSFDTAHVWREYLTSTRSLELEFQNGHLMVTYARTTRSARTATEQEISLGPLGAFWFYARDAAGGTWRYVRLGLPLWILVIVLLTYPVVAFVRGPLRIYRRSKCNQCLQCGYDLTGNTSGVCPECGEQLVPKGAQNARTPKMRTPRRVRLTVWNWLFFSTVHVLACAGIGYVMKALMARRSASNPLGPPPSGCVIIILFMMSPVFGYIWAQLYVGWRRGQVRPATSSQ